MDNYTIGPSGPDSLQMLSSSHSHALLTFFLLQVVLGNLLSHTDMQRVIKGVDYIYFSFAVQDGLLEASTIAAVVAAEAGALRCADSADAQS